MNAPVRKSLWAAIARQVRPSPAPAPPLESAPPPHAGKSQAELKGLARDLDYLAMGHRAEAQRASAERDQLLAALPDAQRVPVEVTDHALVRWLERVEGMDLAGVRARLAALVSVSAGDPLHSERVVRHAGAKLVVVDNRVVTVLGEDQHPKRRPHKSRRR